MVDDGSTDETEELCSEFAGEAKFPYRYIRQANGGKHAAINRGAVEAKGEWFFIVDSDDFLPDDSIEVNETYLSEIEEDPDFAGVSGVRARADGSWLIGLDKNLDDVDRRTRELFSQEYIDATAQDYRIRLKMPGDRAEIVKTELVRKYPFPVFVGERFVSEVYLWWSISEEGLRFRWFNRPTYLADYLEDGLSVNARSISRKSPLGRSFVDNFVMGCHVPLRVKIKPAINYTRYGRFGGSSIPNLMRGARNRPLALLGLPIAVAMPLKGGEE